MDGFEARLTAAYDAWHASRGRTPDRFFALYDDTIEIRSILDTALPGEPSRGPYFGKDAALFYYTAVAEAWEMLEGRTDTIVARGDTLVWIGHATWRNLRTLHVVSGPKIDVWTVRDGLAVRFFEIYDSYGAARAMGLIE
jgi:ketosteroid isomerase-like protein